MNSHKIVAQIYETTDYDLFKFEKTNRKVKNVTKLKNEIEEKGLMYEILVDKNYTIIDGQHRFEALKQLGFPIQFKVIEQAGVNEMISINTTSRNWGEKEYIEHYAKKGIKDYQSLIQLSKDYSIPFATLTRSNLVAGKIKEGTMKLSSFNIANQTLKKYTEFMECVQMKRTSQSSFASFCELSNADNYNHELFLDKAKKLKEKYALNESVSSKNIQLEIYLKANNYGLSESSENFIKYYFTRNKKIELA